MKSEEQSSAMEWLENWALEKGPFLESLGCLVNTKRSKYGSSVVDIYSEEVVSAICAWRHGNTLEIHTIESGSNDPVLVFDGPCESESYFLQELNSFEKWLKIKHAISN